MGWAYWRKNNIEEVNKFIYKANISCGTFAFAVSKTNVDFIINKFKLLNAPVDSILISEIQNILNCYVLIHNLIVARLNDPKSRCSKLDKKINLYSFALKPEEHQPSGTCNFSRLDNAKLSTASSLSSSDNIYAVNYNILRIMSGMAGLAYSN